MGFEIKISELRSIINHLLDGVEGEVGPAGIRIERSDYWDVKDEERYESSMPTGYGVGNLKDDWEFLLPILDDPEMAVRLALVHVSPILQKLGCSDFLGELRELR
jgi:hypothetical protein